MYEVVSPCGKRTAEGTRLANRLATLGGKTVCEVWDWAFHGNRIFPMLEKELARRYPGIKFVSYEAFGPTLGAEETRFFAGLADRLRQNRCNAVISAVGC